MRACACRQVGDNKGYNCITDDDFLSGICNYTSMVEPLQGASSNHITADGPLYNSQVAKLVEPISDITRKDMLQEEISGLP